MCESLRSRIEEVGDKNKDDPEIQVGCFSYGYTLLFLPSKYRLRVKFTEFWYEAIKIEDTLQALSF